MKKHTELRRSGVSILVLRAANDQDSRTLREFLV